MRQYQKSRAYIHLIQARGITYSAIAPISGNMNSQAKSLLTFILQFSTKLCSMQSKLECRRSIHVLLLVNIIHAARQAFFILPILLVAPSVALRWKANA